MDINNSDQSTHQPQDIAQQPVPQPAMPGYPQPIATSRSSLLVPILIAAWLTIVGLGAVIYFAVLKDTKSGSGKQHIEQALSPVVPEDWSGIDTSLGFSVKVPKEWDIAKSGDSNIGNLLTTSVSLGPKGVISAQTAEDLQDGFYITATKESIKGSTDPKLFEDTITNKNGALDAEIEALGITKDDVKISHKKIMIKNKEWLQVDVLISGQFVQNIYYWNETHAFGLNISANSKEELDNYINTYLLPVAASIEIK